MISSFPVNDQKNPTWKILNKITYQEQNIFHFPYVQPEMHMLRFQLPGIHFNIQTTVRSCYWTNREDKWILRNENEASTSSQTLPTLTDHKFWSLRELSISKRHKLHIQVGFLLAFAMWVEFLEKSQPKILQITTFYLFDPAQPKLRWGSHVWKKGIQSKL